MTNAATDCAETARAMSAVTKRKAAWCDACQRYVERPPFPVIPCNKCGEPVVTANSICGECEEAWTNARR